MILRHLMEKAREINHHPLGQADTITLNLEAGV
jgi:hypothetical protein